MVFQMKNKLIIYAVVSVIIFLSTSLFINQCKIERLQQEYAKYDYEDFKDKVIIANQKIRNLKILNKNLSRDLTEFEKGFDKLNIENVAIEKKLKAKKKELKKSGQTTEQLLAKNIELIFLHEQNEITLKLTIANLTKQRDTWKGKYNLEVKAKIYYRDLYLDCSSKYEKLYDLKFKPDRKYKYIIIGETVLFIAYLFLKK